MCVYVTIKKGNDVESRDFVKYENQVLLFCLRMFVCWLGTWHTFLCHDDDGVHVTLL